jgi:4-oxalocrotonate tautomerase
MPFVRVTVLAPALAAEQIARLRHDTTRLMASIMRKPLEGISLLIEHVREGAWSIADVPVSVAAQVDALIGVGTNTPEEKARFMAAMMALLRSTLGPELREATYIALRELPHHSYGRGGLTRAERDGRRTDAAGEASAGRS